MLSKLQQRLKVLVGIPNHLKTCMIVSAITLVLSSCSTNQLVTQSVAYQSVRTENTKHPDVPESAEIVTLYAIDQDGGLSVVVCNRTDEIMVIDQTMSFFVNTNGQSTSYYDPTVRTTTTTDVSSSTKGASVNLGAIGGALGVNGALGSLLNGINVGGSGTSGQAVSNTTYFADLPKISLAPKSTGAMSKVFKVSGLGYSYMGNVTEASINLTPKVSTVKFSVCISYSLDGGQTFKKIVTNMYNNSSICIPVKSKGMVNEALRELYTVKSDALAEPWWMLYFNNNISRSEFGLYDYRLQGSLYDYQ